MYFATRPRCPGPSELATAAAVPTTGGMRVCRAAWMAAFGIAIVAGGGCVGGDTGAVLLHFTESVDLSPPLTTYGSSTAAVSFSAEGPVLLSATSSQGLLHVLVPGPLVDGATIDLPADDERVQFQLEGGGWGNRGGTLVVLSVDPVVVQLAGVPMVARTGAAVGSFVFEGSGTFR